MEPAFPGRLVNRESLFFQEESSIPEKYRFGAPRTRLEYLVGGEVRLWSGPSVDIVSPVPVLKKGVLERKRLGRAPLLSAEEALSALASARRAFASGTGEWPSLPLQERAASVRAFIARLVKKKALITKTIMWEIAKPYREVEDEFDRTAGFLGRLLEDAGALERKAGRMKRDRGISGFVRREPLGVALCLGPYNYPLFETLSLVFPALIAGNTVVMKPPRFGVLFFEDLLEDLRDCFPAGAVNVVFGDGPELVEPVMRSGGVDVFAFIGRTSTANRLIELHPRKNRLKSLLGLEAKNTAVVLPDADLDVAVRECLLGSLAFNGQRCAALKMVFVHESAAEAFLSKMAASLRSLKVGMPWARGVRITPLAEPERLPYLAGLVEDAVANGARVLNEHGGQTVGTIFRPALLYPVGRAMRLYHEEQFGPIIPVAPFSELAEAVGYLHETSFGQQASIFGGDPRSLASFIRAVSAEVARVNINAKCQRGPDAFPFTGRKDSAHGDLASPAVLEFFSEPFTVTVRSGGGQERLLRRLLK
jgi:glyceraldehyde-3-phosphate dehydrogenase (NADP+)